MDWYAVMAVWSDEDYDAYSSYGKMAFVRASSQEEAISMLSKQMPYKEGVSFQAMRCPDQGEGGQ